MPPTDTKNDRAGPIVDVKAFTVEELRRIEALAAGLMQNGLKLKTQRELDSLIGRPVTREDASALKSSVTEYLRAHHKGVPHRSRAAPPPRKQPRSKAIALRDVSPLKLAGYGVGSQGGDDRTRREILELFVCAFSIPRRGFGGRYVRAWGEPGSDRRKKRTERFLRQLSTLNGASAGREVAVADWLSDLAWLRARHLSNGRLVSVKSDRHRKARQRS